MIRHSVILKFKPTRNNSEKQAFFDAVDTLKNIEGVLKFEVLREISSKNHFEYGISMEFESQEKYDYYTNHPTHLAFVENYWMSNIDDFLEIDYQL